AVAGRDPVCRPTEEIFVAATWKREGHPHRMLAVRGSLQVLQKPDHEVLPLPRGAGALVGDLPQHVVQVPHGLYHLAYVQLLHLCDCGDPQRMDSGPVSPGIGVAVDAVDVVPPVEGMAIPGVALALVVNRPAV